MNASHVNPFRIIAACAVLAVVASHGAFAQAQPGSAEDDMDPMDSLLEFGASPTDQIPPPPETNALKLIVIESAGLRDPFWPVGYTPPAPKQPTDPIVETVETPVIELEPRWDDALREVAVKGIMSVGGGRFMAVVNDQVVGEKDTVTVTHGGRSYSWRINSITAQGVKFQKLTSTR